MPRSPDPTVGDGLLVLDKPDGWTSHAVVSACRRLAGTRKVGHAGTLDPLATGVLIIGVNRATRLLTYLLGADKAYSATIRLGQATVTDDAEGDVTVTAPEGAVTVLAGPERDRVDAAVGALTGALHQVPSSVSAIKIDGKRSYARVRAGQDVDLAARPVRVDRFTILDRRLVTLPSGAPGLDLDVEVHVSSGTYVRALARDLGRTLGTGAHLTALRRTAVGPFVLDQAHTMDDLAAARAAGSPRPVDSAVGVPGTNGLPLVGLADAARAVLPARELDADEAHRLGHGIRIPSASPARPGPVAAFAPDGALVAVVDESGQRVRPQAVFVSSSASSASSPRAAAAPEGSRERR